MCKHLYRSMGRSGNRKTNRFRCLHCNMWIAIPHDIVKLLVQGKAKRLRARHIHELNPLPYR